MVVIMKKIDFIIPLYLFIFYIVLSVSGTAIFAGNEPSGTKSKHPKNPYADAEISVKIIPSLNNTFGYDIIVNKKTFVHQPHIPAISGNKGFPSEVTARKVAEFVVKKIKRNEMPPAVTLDDLKKMGVLKHN